MEGLIGKLGFPQSDVFGKFARVRMRHLYKKLYTERYRPTLPPRESSALFWRCAIFCSLLPRISRAPNCRAGLITYSDASTLSNRIAALRIRPGSESPVIYQLCVTMTHRFWSSKFHRADAILGMGMLAHLALLWSDPAIVRGIRVILYLDHETSGSAHIRGDFANPFIAATVCVFWRLVGRLSIDIWIGMVGTKVNPSDRPNGNVKLPFPVVNRSQFTRLFALGCETRKFL